MNTEKSYSETTRGAAPVKQRHIVLDALRGLGVSMGLAATAAVAAAVFIE